MYNKLKEKFTVFVIQRICKKINSCFVVKDESDYLEVGKFFEVLDRYLKWIKIVGYIFLIILDISILTVLVIVINNIYIAFLIGVFLQILFNYIIEDQKYLLIGIRLAIMQFYKIY